MKELQIKLYNFVIDNLHDVTEEERNNIEDFIEDLLFSFLNESSLCTTVYMDRFENTNTFNTILYILTAIGAICSDVKSNYGSIAMLDSFIEQLYTKEQLRDIRMQYKLYKYKPRYYKSLTDNLVLLNRKLTKSGLVRKGFAKVSRYSFKYDTEIMEKYIYDIANEILKGLDTSTKSVTYEEIVIELLAIITNSDSKYSTEKCYIDSRGRSIFQCQKRVFNPVSNKTARSLLIIPSKMITKTDIASQSAIFAFCAELNHFKGIGGSYAQKAITGQNMASQRYISPEADLHERIWIERIYKLLDILDKEGKVRWDIPIEIDATASVIMFLGIFLNKHEYLRKTNVIGDIIEDAWSMEGIDRTMLKKFMTRQVYGSTISAKETLVELDIPYTQEDVNKLNSLLDTSLFSTALKFKDFLVSNAVFDNFTNIKIGNDSFFVQCNKFKWQETTPKTYVVFTSPQGLFKRIDRQLENIPDLKRFKRFSPTLLIHNADSQVANYVCEHLNSWIIPNHDAFLVHPLDVTKTKTLYAVKLFDLYQNRHEILKEYLQSIGIICDKIDSGEGELTFEDFNIDTILK